MKRTIIGMIIGSVVGGITFFPPAIPLFLTLNYGTRTSSKIEDNIFWLLPLIGSIIGGLIGGFVGKNRISLVPFENKPLSIFSWCVWIFWLIGLESGFILSPATMIGLGNTSSKADLWLFAIPTTMIGTISGILVGLLILAVYLPVQKFNARKK